MRKITRIVLHSTSGWGNQSTESIKDYWKNTLGWRRVGYHKLINLDGSIEDLAPLSAVTNGVAGYNSDSVHICYKGGLLDVKVDRSGNKKFVYGDTRSDAQKDAFFKAINDVLNELKQYQSVDDITIVGHRDLSPDLNNNGKIEQREWVKVCPTFDAIEEYGWMAGAKALKRMENRKTY